MRTVINNTNFGDIGIAVFYRWHKYIPTCDILEEDLNDLINSCKPDKIQYKGSRQYTSLRDFSEYSFSYNIDKFKFNDKFLINLLNDESKEMVGKNIDDLEKISNVLFPTITEDDREYEDTFFGSSVSSQTLIVFGGDGSTEEKLGHWKLELYEMGVNSNNNIFGGFIEEDLLNKLGIEITNHPIMTIILGPESNVPNNSSDMYYSYDPMLSDKNLNSRLSLVEYKKLYEEITKSKSIWLLLSQDNNEIESINLSYRSWIDSSNPNRNMKDYVVRNDEYYSTKNSLKTIEKLDNTEFWYDKNSGTIVGNKINTNHPILDRKLSSLTNNNNYSPYINYNLGDKVVFGKKKINASGETEDLIWVSLHSNNIGNSPVFSNSWSLESSITGIFTSRIFVSSYPSDAGYSNPSGSITIANSNSSKIFYINESLGYKLQELDGDKSPVSSDIGNNSYVPGGGNIWNFIEDPYYGIIIYNWTPFLKTGKLVFNFQYCGCFIDFKLITVNGIESSYDQWESYVPGFKLDNVVVNDQQKLPEFDSNYQLNFNPNDKVTYIFSKLKEYSVSKITTSSGDILEVSSNDGVISFSDNINSNQISYLLYLENKTLIVTLTEFSGFEISQPITEVIYGNTYNVQFYGDTFDKAIVKDQLNNEVEISKSQIGSLVTFGESNILIEYNQNSEIYTITISNITRNLEINLYK